MRGNSVIQPIGANVFCEEVRMVCNKADMYRRCGLKPDHLVIPMDGKSGRTTLIEYMADMYKKHQVLDFDSGLDDYIELTLDGTLTQLRQAIIEVKSAAVYKNEFTGIVAIDISELSSHLNEIQWTEFLNHFKPICDNACMVFFISTKVKCNEKRMVDKLREQVGKIKYIELQPYTCYEFCHIILRIIESHGVKTLSKEEAVMSLLEEMVKKETELCLRSAISFAEDAISFADFTGSTPVMHAENFVEWIAERFNAPVRR